MNKMRKTRAFTLIELMVVILILAILAALIVPRVVGSAGKAKVAKAQSDIAELHKMLTQFKLDNDRYPTTQEGLQALVTPPSNVKVTKSYIDGALTNDPWDNPYYYECPGQNGQDFTLMSYGADKAPGGTDENTDIIDGQPYAAQQ